MKVFAAIGLLAIIFAVVAALYFFGGFYSVAANREDPAIVHWALVKIRTNSIVHNAQINPPQALTILPKCRLAHVLSASSVVSTAMARPA